MHVRQVKLWRPRHQTQRFYNFLFPPASPAVVSFLFFIQRLLFVSAFSILVLVLQRRDLGDTPSPPSFGVNTVYNSPLQVRRCRPIFLLFLLLFLLCKALIYAFLPCPCSQQILPCPPPSVITSVLCCPSAAAVRVQQCKSAKSSAGTQVPKSSASINSPLPLRVPRCPDIKEATFTVLHRLGCCALPLGGSGRGAHVHMSSPAAHAVWRLYHLVYISIA